jgi:hypothetical protein
LGAAAQALQPFRLRSFELRRTGRLTRPTRSRIDPGFACLIDGALDRPAAEAPKSLEFMVRAVCWMRPAPNHVHGFSAVRARRSVVRSEFALGLRCQDTILRRHNYTGRPRKRSIQHRHRCHTRDSWTMPQPTSDSPKIALQPPCPSCAAPMWLVRHKAFMPDHGLHTFECQVCGHSESIVLKFR